MQQECAIFIWTYRGFLTAAVAEVWDYRLTPVTVDNDRLTRGGRWKSIQSIVSHLLTGTSCASMSSPNHSQSVALLETSFIPWRGWISRKKLLVLCFVKDESTDRMCDSLNHVNIALMHWWPYLACACLCISPTSQWNSRRSSSVLSLLLPVFCLIPLIVLTWVRKWFIALLLCPSHSIFFNTSISLFPSL